MAYNEQLADRVRIFLAEESDVEEKKMFGGMAFMVNGKMCVGVVKDDLMARINPEQQDAALERNGCREMEFTGKPMKGYVFVDPFGTEKDQDLKYWVQLALDFNVLAKASKKKSR